jgi:hypothetical protein
MKIEYQFKEKILGINARIVSQGGKYIIDSSSFPNIRKECYSSLEDAKKKLASAIIAQYSAASKDLEERMKELESLIELCEPVLDKPASLNRWLNILNRLEANESC